MIYVFTWSDEGAFYEHAFTGFAALPLAYRAWAETHGVTRHDCLSFNVRCVREL